MKYCPKCNKVYNDNLFFCSDCGSKLEHVVEYDIFGEPIEEKVNKQAEQGTTTFINKEDKNAKFLRNSEMFAFISIGFSMVPFYGFIFCLASLIMNIKAYSLNKKHLVYIILSIVTLLFNIVFFILEIRYGVFQNIIEIAEEPQA